MSICRYYEILIYSWLTWLTRFAVQMCKLVKAADGLFTKPSIFSSHSSPVIRKPVNGATGERLNRRIP